jgi:hypothetical protein
MRRLLILAVILFCYQAAIAQVGYKTASVVNLNDPNSSGLAKRLDQQYKSAVHIVDTSKCVFKTPKQQEAMGKAYNDFLQEFGNYLRSQKFYWAQPAKGWNRLFFAPGGTVDYYLFSFENEMSDERIFRFKELFSTFAATHKIGITASTGFAQCSHVTYTDK